MSKEAVILKNGEGESMSVLGAGVRFLLPAEKTDRNFSLMEVELPKDQGPPPHGGHLAAVSYFDIGERSNSGIYAMFDPAFSSRRLGIFTILKEIEYAASTGKEFYYQGYAYEGTSFYDYKKQFRGSEAFDWMGNWGEFEVRATSNECKETLE